MENVHKPHNQSAIVRSCDAVGVHEIHAVSYLPALHTRKNPASGASQWVKIKTHSDLCNAGSYLKSQNMQILAAHPKLAKFYQNKGLDYPDMDEDGDILETAEHRQVRLASHSC